MNSFDQAARYGARNLDAAGFFAWLFRAAKASWRWAGWVDTQNVAFPGEPDRRCDTVARFESRRGAAAPVAAVVEFMTTPRAEVYPRLAEYALRVHREVPFHSRPLVAYRVVTALIHLTSPGPDAEWSMAPDDFGELGLWTKSRVLTFAEVEARALFNEIDRGTTSRALLAWGPLLKGAEAPEVVAEWQRLVLREPNERKRRDLGGLAKVFARLTERQDVWFPCLEGLNVEESPVVKEWQDKAVVAALRKKALLVLQDKFPGAVLSDLEAALNAQKDIDTMNEWFDRVFRAQTLDEVRAAFGLSGAAAKKRENGGGEMCPDDFGTTLLRPEGMNVEESSVLVGVGRPGAVKALREKVLLVLRNKFPGEALPDLETILNRQNDAAVMSQWFDRAFDAKTLDEVRAAFGLSGGSAKKTPKRRR